MVATISGGKITGISLLGEPLVVTSSSVQASAASSGPDFSLTLTCVPPNSAKGTHENNPKEKTTALFGRN